MKRISLTQGKEALVDDRDFFSISQFRWHFDGGYAKRREKQPDGTWRAVPMQNQILGIPPGEIVDHRNFSPLDNRRKNLRPASRSQNNHHIRIRRDNKSGVKGVYWHAQSQRFRAQLKEKCLGNFKSLEEARLVYVSAAKAVFGEFASV